MLAKLPACNSSLSLPRDFFVIHHTGLISDARGEKFLVKKIMKIVLKLDTEKSSGLPIAILLKTPEVVHIGGWIDLYFTT